MRGRKDSPSVPTVSMMAATESSVILEGRFMSHCLLWAAIRQDAENGICNQIDERVAVVLIRREAEVRILMDDE